MVVVEAILAVVGLLFLLLLIVGSLMRDKPEAPAPPPEADLAAPYREGLHAAVRLQRSAQDLEAQIWAEAARHAGTDIRAGSES
jgi:hypothetical protein